MGLGSSDAAVAQYWSNGPEQLEESMKRGAVPHFPSRTLDEMTEMEIRELEQRYGAKVKRTMKRMTEMEFYAGLSEIQVKNCARTPQPLFDSLHSEFGFTLDAAATEWDTKCERYNSPLEPNKYSWAGERVWNNPPWKWTGRWVEHAFGHLDRRESPLIVQLVPAGLSAKWFDDYAARATEVRRVGRLAFDAPPGLRYSTPMWEALVLVFIAGQLNDDHGRVNFVLCDELGRPMRRVA